ncbi:hypothetical protein CEP52_015969 [Fusarium oligoseptatum]|uniref:Cytidyltransferase-like domain-containing protein n=1 Tax=Fusarium oligoseptatum TaxID=2604345 RepID=A0A428S7Y1_9HYPO|nr:hypothetical protein CEP52_015969 [Fusarium oligoseptatum]
MMAFRPLANYAEAIHFQGKDASGLTNRPFNNGSADAAPILRPRGVNRILLFPGSFNPPHQGHLKLLQHVFNNAGDDLNIVAAIVIMTDDDRLKDKLCTEEKPLILSREQRANLWRGTGIPVNWVWIYDKSESEWDTFRTQLSGKVRKDGIDLKFILLGGPDVIGAGGMCNPEYWKCADCITSDISRAVDFRYPNTLRQIPGCSMWERLTFDRTRLEGQIRARLRGKPAAAIEEAISAAFAKLSSISVCRRQRKPKGTVRFLPCDLNLRPSEPPSSTKIRQIVATAPKEELQAMLEGIALSPAILTEYINKSQI